MDTVIDYFNVGTGTGLSVQEIVDGFKKHTGVDLPVIQGERRSGDIEQIWADTQKVETVLNWKPQKTLEDMVVSSWNWQKTLEQPE
jgi:UDP-glucose 4-epimerase